MNINGYVVSLFHLSQGGRGGNGCTKCIFSIQHHYVLMGFCIKMYSSLYLGHQEHCWLLKTRIRQAWLSRGFCNCLSAAYYRDYMDHFMAPGMNNMEIPKIRLAWQRLQLTGSPGVQVGDKVESSSQTRSLLMSKLKFVVVGRRNSRRNLDTERIYIQGAVLSFWFHLVLPINVYQSKSALKRV